MRSIRAKYLFSLMLAFIAFCSVFDSLSADNKEPVDNEEASVSQNQDAPEKSFRFVDEDPAGLDEPSAEDMEQRFQEYLYMMELKKSDERIKKELERRKKAYEESTRLVPLYPYKDRNQKAMAAKALHKGMKQGTLDRAPSAQRSIPRPMVSRYDPRKPYLEAAAKEAIARGKSRWLTYVLGFMVIGMCGYILKQYYEYKREMASGPEAIHGALDDVHIHRRHAVEELTHAVERRKRYRKLNLAAHGPSAKQAPAPVLQENEVTETPSHRRSRRLRKLSTNKVPVVKNPSKKTTSKKDSKPLRKLSDTKSIDKNKSKLTDTKKLRKLGSQES